MGMSNGTSLAGSSVMEDRASIWLDCVWYSNDCCLMRVKSALIQLERHVAKNGLKSPSTSCEKLEWLGLTSKNDDLGCLLARGKPCPLAVDKPHFDDARRELSAGSVVIMRVIRPRNQERVLRAFQEQNWPPRIDDPLGDDAAIADNKLRDVVYLLNRSQKPWLIQFTCDGTGSGVRWNFVANSTPAR